MDVMNAYKNGLDGTGTDINAYKWIQTNMYEEST